MRAQEPPSAEGSIAFSANQDEKLTGGNQSYGQQSAADVSIEWLQRRPSPWPQWYWGFGLCADAYTFRGASNFSLRHLRDVAAEFSLEYYIHHEAVASVTVRPGFYFENHPSLGALDIPIEAVSGVPLTASLSGVMGFLDARFYRSFIPVAGLVWLPSKQVRVEAVFPEPALVVAVSRKLELRLAGELGGAGFRLDTLVPHQPVEYSTYRVGAAVGYQLCPRWRTIVGVGYDIERTFDFLNQGTRFHARGAPYFKLNLSFTR